MFIAGLAVAGAEGGRRAINPATGETLEPEFGGATPDDVAKACILADAVFDAYRNTSADLRAAFLEKIAENIVAIGDALIKRCMAETGLPRARLEGERGRTIGQLRLFAEIVRSGDYLGLRVDPAMPERQPLPRPDLRLRYIPLGPVAIFGASNFPLAFSVAGGDTASALAAGCPVVVKAHPAHPGTSELVARAIRDAVTACGLPDEIFSLIFDSDYAVGQALVADPRIKAVGFTGSRRGGLALMAIAEARPEPIPVYAEMSSINPVILMPGALAARAEAIGTAFVGSLTLGSGQFCTNPGLVLMVDGKEVERFVASAAQLLESAPATTMLTPGIHLAYAQATSVTASNPAVQLVACGHAGKGYASQAMLFATTGEAFLKDHSLQQEMFGAASLLVRCKDMAELKAVLSSLEGQLTASLHLEADDHAEVQVLLPLLERKVGRILVNGFGTGVEVSHAMVHGGPFPSTSDARTTSVGGLAIQRFLRPVCYQDFPDALLPDVLKADNPLKYNRMVNGKAADRK
jgi:NADP-dependent aldehyde dehydrogenase